MRTRVAAIVLIAAAAACVPSPAAAAGMDDIIDWIRELHGPGPSWAISKGYRFLCVARSVDIVAAAGSGTPSPDPAETSWLAPWDRGAGVRPSRELGPTEIRDAVLKGDYDGAGRLLCEAGERVKGYATLRVRFVQSFENNLFPADPTNPEYRVRTLDFTVSYYARLHDTTDLGMGAGVGRFFGPKFEPFHRVLLDMANVRFYPLAMAGDQAKYRAVGISLAAQLYVPGFEGADFCNRGSCAGLRPYQASPHFQWRVGFIASVPGLIRLLRD